VELKKCKKTQELLNKMLHDGHKNKNKKL